MRSSMLLERVLPAGDELPAGVRAELDRFAAEPPADGAMVLHGLPIGEPPATPAGPTVPFEKDDVSETTLLAVASHLGEVVGYLPEHGGDLVQNLVPTVECAERQISPSSYVDLESPTETAFHPHLPRYVLLLCLKGDP